MTKSILIIFVVGMLFGCVSGTKPADTYVGRDGRTVIIESDSEMCRRACNEDYARCMDTRAAGDSGINGSSEIFGASAECRTALQRCLSSCKAR
ncbi:MAG: hypothetical protein WC464_03540 [Bdellovibrionales bacterium]